MQNYDMTKAHVALNRLITTIGQGSMRFEEYAPSQTKNIQNLHDDGIWDKKSLLSCNTMRKWYAGYLDFLWEGP